jgi:DNA-binding response OmpR family regulator
MRLGVKPRILVVEDVPSIAATICSHLVGEGFAVDTIGDGESAALADLAPYAAATLDAMLPRLSGFQVCRRWRTESSLPVLMVTALNDPADRAEAFAAGVDDFITKPFEGTELLARLGRLLQRREQAPGASSATRTVGDLRINLVDRVAEVRGRRVRLTPAESRVLGLLADEPGRAFTREEIARHIWGSTYVGESRACDVHIKNLRRKIEDDPLNPDRIRTQRGTGYSLHDPDAR